ncbi:MAG: hypothetical protein LDL41_00095 [Coleofasciculus sp. S288]|nr:hypothetical protein [Coleofasciculus sp. S288]
MSTRSSGLVCSPRPIADSQAVTNRLTATTGNPRLMELMKSLYQADQQVKYLHLQAEVNSLLQQLEILKQQRLASGFTDAAYREQ